MDLWWQEYEGGKFLTLHVGLLGNQEGSHALASLRRAQKWWSVWIDLPGCQASKPYMPLEQAKADVEAKVQEWFGYANTSRPSTLTSRDDE